MNKELILKFNSPYTYEGEEHESVDITGITNLTAKDIISADKIFINSGQMAAVKETSMGYICIIAHKASQKPIEFFENLSIQEAMKLKNMVADFLVELV